MNKFKFLLKLFIFLLPILSLLGWIEYRLSHFPNRYYEKRSQLESRLSEIKVINTGNSHAFLGINYHALNYAGFNLAELSQDLFYDQQMIFKYLDRLPNLKLVIIPVSYMTLEYSLEDSPEPWRRYDYSRVYHLPCSRKRSLWEELDAKNFSYIALYSPDEVQKMAFNYFKFEDSKYNIDKAGYLVVNDTYSQNINNEEGQKRVALHHASMKSNYLAENVAILKETIHQLQDKKINIALITLPVNNTYARFLQPDRYNRMQMELKNLATSLNVEYHNYLRDGRFVLGDFVDNDHLNQQGSEKLMEIMKSEFINKVLNN